MNPDKSQGELEMNRRNLLFNSAFRIRHPKLQFILHPSAFILVFLLLASCPFLSCLDWSDDASPALRDDENDDDYLLSPSECDALITQIYDVCQSDVNTWVRDEALGYCYGGGNADWVCLKGCTNQFANDCGAIFSCSVSNCF